MINWDDNVYLELYATNGRGFRIPIPATALSIVRNGIRVTLGPITLPETCTLEPRAAVVRKRVNVTFRGDPLYEKMYEVSMTMPSYAVIAERDIVSLNFDVGIT